VFECESSNNDLVASTDSGPPDRTEDTWYLTSSNTRLSQDASLAHNDKSEVHDFGDHTTLDPLAPYMSADINFTSTGTHYVHLRAAQRTSSTALRTHLALMRAVTSISAGGSGPQTVTLAGNHGLNATNSGAKIYFEGLDVGDYNNATGYDITGASGATFTIADTGFGAAGAQGYAFGEETLLGMYHAQAGTHSYTWSDVDSSSNAITMSIPATGAYELRLYVQDYQSIVDKIVITTNASYDTDIDDSGDSSNTSLDEAFGPVVSEFAAGTTPIDNTENNPSLPWPLPSATVNATFIDPIDAGSAPSSTSIYCEFANMTGLQLNSFEISDGGEPITGTLTSTNNSITFTSSSNLAPGNTYTVSMAGRIIATDGDMKSIQTASEPWTFTVVDPEGDPDIIFSQNFTGIAASLPHVLTRTDLESAFNEQLDAGTEGNACITNGNAVLVDDPFGTGRGPVMRVIYYKDMYSYGKSTVTTPIPSGIRFYYYLPTDLSEVYCSWSVAFPPDYVWHKSTKTNSIQSDHMDASSDPDLYGTRIGCRTVYEGNADGSVSNLPQCDADGSSSLYYYSASRARAHWYATDPLQSSPPSQCDQGGPYFILPTGRWHKIEMHVKNNTVGVNNGEARMWANGKLVVEQTDVDWISSVDSALKWGRFMVNLRHGGDEQKYACSRTQYIYYDDFIISESRIAG